MNKGVLRLTLEALEYNDYLRGVAITAIKQALEQPEPEPVVTVYEGAVAKWNLPEKFTGFLYTSLPKREWQGLTDVDVSKILDEQNGFYTFEKCFNFAKAIEAKLKEKNT
jgi:hypothetical protein